MLAVICAGRAERRLSDRDIEARLTAIPGIGS
jgi:hypothetical protein